MLGQQSKPKTFDLRAEGGLLYSDIVVCGMHQTKAVDEDAMKAFFDKFDTDANGTISFDEQLEQKWVVCWDYSRLKCPYGVVDQSGQSAGQCLPRQNSSTQHKTADLRFVDMTLDLGIAPLKAEELKKDEVRDLAEESAFHVDVL